MNKHIEYGILGFIFGFILAKLIREKATLPVAICGTIVGIGHAELSR